MKYLKWLGILLLAPFGAMVGVYIDDQNDGFDPALYSIFYCNEQVALLAFDGQDVFFIPKESPQSNQMAAELATRGFPGKSGGNQVIQLKTHCNQRKEDLHS